jgi:hypothetical protein
MTEIAPEVFCVGSQWRPGLASGHFDLGLHGAVLIDQPSG